MIAFTVTTDLIDANLEGRRFQSPGCMLGKIGSPRNDKNRKGWRLKDDDGEVYLVGLIVFDEASEPEGYFAPLDQFRDSLGCTSIEYQLDGSKAWTQV